MDKKETRKRRIFEIVEASQMNDPVSKIYDILILVTVAVGLVPLTMRRENIYVDAIDVLVGMVFFFDYIIRLYTADYKMGIKCYKAYVAYALSAMAIVDLLSVIPILAVFFPNSILIGVFRFFRMFRLFSVLKLGRYSKTMIIIRNVVRKVKGQLLAVLLLTMIYITVSAMFIYQIEPQSFKTFFDALYWATISITTIGYGDISPVTPVGRVITMFSALVGVAVIALPSGIITAAYMDEVKKKKSRFEI